MRKLGTLFAMLLVGAFLVTPAVAGHEMEDDDDNKISLHGNLWIRGLLSDNFSDFDNDAKDTFDMFQHRVRIGVKADLGSNVFVFAQLQNYDFWGNRDSDSDTSPGPFSRPPLGDPDGDTPFSDGVCDTFGCRFLGEFDTDEQEISLYQAFIAVKDVGGSSFSFKLGRQEVRMGSELILGDLDWYGGISHDGFVGGWDTEPVDIHILYTRVDESSDFDSFNEEDFWGGWADWNWGDSSVQSTAYLFNNRDDALAGPRNFWTYGARAYQYAEDHRGLSWSVEYAIQTGDDDATVDVDADVAEAWLSWGFGGKRDQSFHFGITQASGDDSSSVDDNEDFDPLFQDFHYRLGLADFFTTTNIEALEVGYKVAFGDHKFGIDLYDFTLEEDNGAASGDDLGSEVDVWYKYQATENLDYNIGLAYFSPDDAITGVGGVDDEATQIWAQVRVRF